MSRRDTAINIAMSRIFVVFAALALLLSVDRSTALAQIEIEAKPFNYGKAPTNDAVTRLQKQLRTGGVQLEFDEDHGYLRSVLRMLDIEPSSQVLVSSKTSFQLRRISPRRPRALYFNDETYIGWVQGGDVIEVMTTDPVQGAVFYTLSQESGKDSGRHPKFIRDRGQCITCHASSRTQGVPGGVVRSVFMDARGQPHFGSGTFTIDHRSPFTERWGGWYVTGTHGKMRHMGNVISEDRQDPETLDRESGANITDLAGRLDVSRYLTPHSDIVALMVLEHQTQIQNYVIRATYESRSVAYHDGVMNAALDRPEEYVSDSAKRRVASAGDKLLRYLLFADEFRLAAPVRGTSTFVKEFEARGPRDSRGRSLRDFDLRTRMFKYPCSYMIYSPSFDRLPESMKKYVLPRLYDVLTGKDTSDAFSHLSSDDRKAILEILTATKPGLWTDHKR